MTDQQPTQDFSAARSNIRKSLASLKLGTTELSLLRRAEGEEIKVKDIINSCAAYASITLVANPNSYGLIVIDKTHLSNQPLAPTSSDLARDLGILDTTTIYFDGHGKFDFSYRIRPEQCNSGIKLDTIDGLKVVVLPLREDGNAQVAIEIFMIPHDSWQEGRKAGLSICSSEGYVPFRSSPEDRLELERVLTQKIELICGTHRSE